MKKIEQTVFSILEKVAKEQLGTNINSKIKIQLELAKYRLKEFAKHQARSVDEGWEIVCSECFKTKELVVQGRKFTIRGTIDRVEVNKNGKVRVLDYKTGSTKANSAHYKKDSCRRHVTLSYFELQGRKHKSRPMCEPRRPWASD